MRTVIHGHPGTIYHAEGHPGFQILRPLYCFVPDGQNADAYQVSRWPSVNAGANPHAVGSHVFPDFNRPVRQNLTCPVLTAFITNLPRYIGKITGDAKP